MAILFLTSIVRIAATLLLVGFLPIFYMQFGEPHPAGGLNAMSVAAALFELSLIMAVSYIFSSLILKKFLARKKLRWLIEGGIVIFLLGISVYIALGITFNLDSIA